ncbi:hypothetical protein ACFX16_046728 [Malus domestica]
MYLNAPGKPQAIISEEAANKMELDQEESKEEPRLRRPPSKKVSLPQSLSSTDGNNTREMKVRQMSSRSSSSGLDRNADSSLRSLQWRYPQERNGSTFHSSCNVLRQC